MRFFRLAPAVLAFSVVALSLAATLESVHMRAQTASPQFFMQIAGDRNATRPEPYKLKLGVWNKIQHTTINNAVVKIEWPPQVKLKQGSPLDSRCVAQGTGLTCSFGNLQQGTYIQLEFVFDMINMFCPSQTIPFRATATASNASTTNSTSYAYASCPTPPNIHLSYQPTETTRTAKQGEKGIRLAHLQVSAGQKNIRLTKLHFVGAEGTELENANNYSLRIDTNGDYKTDTDIQANVQTENGGVTFTDMQFNNDNGIVFRPFVIPTTLEVYADIPENAPGGMVQLKIGTTTGDIAAEEEDTAKPLPSEINVCPNSTTTYCSIFVDWTTTQWTKVTVPSPPPPPPPIVIEFPELQPTVTFEQLRPSRTLKATMRVRNTTDQDIAGLAVTMNMNPHYPIQIEQGTPDCVVRDGYQLSCTNIAIPARGSRDIRVESAVKAFCGNQMAILAYVSGTPEGPVSTQFPVTIDCGPNPSGPKAVMIDMEMPGEVPYQSSFATNVTFTNRGQTAMQNALLRMTTLNYGFARANATTTPGCTIAAGGNEVRCTKTLEPGQSFVMNADWKANMNCGAKIGMAADIFHGYESNGTTNTIEVVCPLVIPTPGTGLCPTEVELGIPFCHTTGFENKGKMESGPAGGTFLHKIVIGPDTTAPSVMGVQQEDPRCFDGGQGGYCKIEHLRPGLTSDVKMNLIVRDRQFCNQTTEIRETLWGIEKQTSGGRYTTPLTIKCTIPTLKMEFAAPAEPVVLGEPGSMTDVPLTLKLTNLGPSRIESRSVYRIAVASNSSGKLRINQLQLPPECKPFGNPPSATTCYESGNFPSLEPGQMIELRTNYLAPRDNFVCTQPGATSRHEFFATTAAQIVNQQNATEGAIWLDPASGAPSGFVTIACPGAVVPPASSSSSSSSASSAPSSSASSVAAIPPLSIVTEPIDEPTTIVRGQQNVRLMRFTATSGPNGSARLVSFRFASPVWYNVNQYSLWADLDGDGVTETLAQERQNSVQLQKISFYNLFTNRPDARVIPKGTTRAFELRGTVSTFSPQATWALKTLQIGFATQDADYIAASIAETNTTLRGIVTNGTCGSCGIAVTSSPSITYTIVNPSGAAELVVTLTSAAPETDGTNVRLNLHVSNPTQMNVRAAVRIAIPAGFIPAAAPANEGCTIDGASLQCPVSVDAGSAIDLTIALQMKSPTNCSIAKGASTATINQLQLSCQ